MAGEPTDLPMSDDDSENTGSELGDSGYEFEQHSGDHPTDDLREPMATGEVHQYFTRPLYNGSTITEGQFLLMMADLILFHKAKKTMVQDILQLIRQCLRLSDRTGTRLPPSGRSLWYRIQKLLDFYDITFLEHAVCDACGSDTHPCGCTKPTVKRVVIFPTVNGFDRRMKVPQYRNDYANELADHQSTTRAESPKVLGSFWDGTAGQRAASMMRSETEPIPVALCVDGMSPQKYSSFSCTPGIVQNILMPTHSRSSRLNFWVTSLVEGASGVGTNYFIQKNIVDQIRTDSRLVLATMTMDSPALSKAMGTLGATAYRGCFRCPIEGRRIGCTMTYGSDAVGEYSEEDVVKKMKESEASLHQVLEKKIPAAQYDRVCSASGFKHLPPIAELQYFHFTENVCDDPFHLVAENFAKNLMTTTKKVLKIFCQDRWKAAVANATAGLRPPTRIAPGIRSWSSGRVWKGFDYLMLLLYSGLPIVEYIMTHLAEGRSGSALLIMKALCEAWALSTASFRILLSHSVTASDIQLCNKILPVIVKLLHSLDPTTMKKLATHRVLHMPSSATALGPLGSDVLMMLNKEAQLQFLGGWITGPNGQFKQAVSCVRIAELVAMLDHEFPSTWNRKLFGDILEADEEDSLFDQSHFDDHNSQNDECIRHERPQAVPTQGKNVDENVLVDWTSKRSCTDEELSSLIQVWSNVLGEYDEIVQRCFRSAGFPEGDRPAERYYFQHVTEQGGEVPDRTIELSGRGKFQDVVVRTKSATRAVAKTDDSYIAISRKGKIVVGEARELWKTTLRLGDAVYEAVAIKVKLFPWDATTTQTGLRMVNTTIHEDAASTGHLIRFENVLGNVALFKSPLSMSQKYAVIIGRGEHATNAELSTNRRSKLKSNLKKAKTIITKLQVSTVEVLRAMDDGSAESDEEAP